jgi:5-formyltetrahydrofolate cyclo-ligase
VTTADELKTTVRETIWSRLETAGAAASPVHGKIPDFAGAEAAARHLTELDEWKLARTVKIVPDRPQQPVRQRALLDGKTVYMAVPKLAAQLPFVILDPAVLGPSVREIDSSDAAVRLGQAADLPDLHPVDFIVCGSVAVNAAGARLGKGAGYADIEVALLTMAGLIGPHTTIATTVHDLQLADEVLPELAHDFGVDLIVTPTRVIRSHRQRRPAGIDWSALSPEKIESIPVLARMNTHRAQSGS